ncbi:MAG: DUF4270 family protein [Deinococcales bacterium]|nr:DUF4270 family protein [Chitinophagaceae bacterium]
MQHKFSTFLLLSLIIGAFACKKVDVQFGNDFVDGSNTQIVKIDTFGVQLSTVYTDSFSTSGLGTSLIGSYKDPIFGTITTQTYFQVAPPAFEDIYENVLFDSITLILKLNKNFYGDSTKPVHIDISRVTQKIEPFDNGFFLFNVNKFKVDGDVLGSKDVLINPNQTDTIFIKLNAALGQELLNKFTTKSDTVKTNETFLNFFKGLRISSNSTSQMVFGCSDSAKLRIHYKKKDLFLANKNIDFKLFNKSLHFNNISVDRSTGSAKLQNLATAKEIDSKLTNNTAYGQASGSTLIKLRFTTIREILKTPNFAKILSARLIVRPVEGSYNRTFYLPPQLRLSTTTSLNQIGTDLSSIGANGAPVIQYGNLFTDYAFGVNTAYSFDITNFIKFAVTDLDINSNNGLILSPPAGAYETSFSRLAIGSRQNNTPNSKIELQIFYAAIK